VGASLDLFSRSGCGSLCRGSLNRGSSRCTTSKSLLFGDHGLNAIVHVLDEVDLRSAESSLVRYVVDVVGGLRVLSVDASDLDMELVSNLLELSLLGSKLGQLDMDRGAEGSSEVCGARGDVTEMFVMSESGDLLDLCASLGQSCEDSTDVSALLH